MIATHMHYSTPDLFQGKTQAVRDLYLLLLGELNKIGPVRETQKEMSVSFENQRPFASAMIRNRSIKLVLRANHKIAHPRIRYTQHVVGNTYDHTIFLETKDEIDKQLMKWLGEAYQAGR